MKLVVGLGNPDKKYENTRHNVGFMVIDNYIGNELWQKKFDSFYVKKVIKGEIVYFIKPLTYMNLSGNAVSSFANFFNIKAEDILVIQDDLDQEIGKFKLKKNSSSGGHNGIKSIIEKLGTDSFSRLKIGISNNKKGDTIDFVLGKFNSFEKEILTKNLEIFNSIIDSFIINGIEKTMNVYNKK